MNRATARFTLRSRLPPADPQSGIEGWRVLRFAGRASLTSQLTCSNGNSGPGQGVARLARIHLVNV